MDRDRLRLMARAHGTGRWLARGINTYRPTWYRPAAPSNGRRRMHTARFKGAAGRWQLIDHAEIAAEKMLRILELTRPEDRLSQPPGTRLK